MSSSSYTILITEGELESVFARIHELHGATFGKNTEDKTRPISAPASDIPHRNKSSTINVHGHAQNKDLQRILDDVKDGLQGLISRTEFDRFLDELERDNGILAERFGYRHRRIIMLAERAMGLGDFELGSGSKAPPTRSNSPTLPNSWPREDLRRWILGSVSFASTAKRGGPDSRNCRWFMCDRPDQVLCFARKSLPAEWADNFIFTTPVYVPKDTIGSDKDTGKRISTPGCDKKIALSMLLVDLISTVSERVDAKRLSGFKKADLPNIRSPAGQLQALVMVLDMCLKALALGRQRPPSLLFDTEHSDKEPLLIIVDRIDSIIGPDTDHYVKKVVLMLKEAACPLTTKAIPEDSAPPAPSTPSALSRLRSFRARDSLPSVKPGVRAGPSTANTIKVLFVIASEEGGTYLDKHCDIPSATNLRVLGDGKLGETKRSIKNEHRAKDRAAGFPESCLILAGIAENDDNAKPQPVQDEEEDLWAVKPNLDVSSLVSTFSPQHSTSPVSENHAKGIASANSNRCVSNTENLAHSRNKDHQKSAQVRPESQVLPTFTALPSLGPLQPPLDRPSTASSSGSGGKRPVSMQLVRDHAIVPGQRDVASSVIKSIVNETAPSGCVHPKKSTATIVSGLTTIPMSPRGESSSLLTPLLSPAQLSPAVLTAKKSPMAKTLGAIVRAMVILPKWKTLVARRTANSGPKRANNNRVKPKHRLKAKTKKATTTTNQKSRPIQLPQGRAFSGKEISLPISVTTSLEMPYPAGAKLDTNNQTTKSGDGKEEKGENKEVATQRMETRK